MLGKMLAFPILGSALLWPLGAGSQLRFGPPVLLQSPAGAPLEVVAGRFLGDDHVYLAAATGCPSEPLCPGAFRVPRKIVLWAFELAAPAAPPIVVRRAGWGVTPLVSLAAGDLDGNGADDLVMAEEGQVSVLLGAPGTPFPARVVMRRVHREWPLRDLALARLRPGNQLDLLALAENGKSIEVLSWSPFSQENPIPLPPDLRGLAVEALDATGDGREDVAVLAARGGPATSSSSAARAAVALLRNRGDGQFGDAGRPDLWQVATVQGWPVAFVKADFDRDGAEDLAVLSIPEMSSCLALLSIVPGTSTGLAHPHPPVELRCGAAEESPAVRWRARDLVVGDFDADGRTDLGVVFRSLDLRGDDPPRGTLSVYLGSGDGTFLLAGRTTLGQGPRRAIAFQHTEPRARIAVAEPSENTVLVAGLELPGGKPPCAGDCNGDGTVTVDEIAAGVAVALGQMALVSCGAMDVNDDSRVTVDELVHALSRALSSCPRANSEVRRGQVPLLLEIREGDALT